MFLVETLTNIQNVVLSYIGIYFIMFWYLSICEITNDANFSKNSWRAGSRTEIWGHIGTIWTPIFFLIPKHWWSHLNKLNKTLNFYLIYLNGTKSSIKDWQLESRKDRPPISKLPLVMNQNPLLPNLPASMPTLFLCVKWRTPKLIQNILTLCHIPSLL